MLRAVIDELAEHGVGGLRVSRVAAAAGVNKTSVYRRWGTREELIGAALRAVVADVSRRLADTGSLRGDLARLVAVVGEEVASKRGRALVLAALSRAVPSPPTGALATSAGAPEREGAEALVARAASRGEWDVERHPPEPVLSMLAGAVLHRVQVEGRPVEEPWVAAVVEVVARGVAPPSLES